MKVAVESKTAAASAGDEQMDLGGNRVAEKRQLKTVEALIPIFHEMRAGKQAERQIHGKDFQRRRHRTDNG